MHRCLQMPPARILIGILCLSVISCSGKGGKSQSDAKTSEQVRGAEEAFIPDDSVYVGWKTYTYQNIKIIYPAGHPQETNIEEIARGYVTALRTDCRFLGINPPIDTVKVYFYTGFGQGMGLTKREYPFAAKGVIHLWMPTLLGPTLMEWLLPRWYAGPPRFKFLKDGLMALLDYSGQNYHAMSLKFFTDTGFIPLARLAVDTTVDIDTERHQTALAASFVDFVTYYYGADALKSLYSAKLPFDSAVPQVFDVPVDTLQAQWIDFVKAAVSQMDKASDSTILRQK